MSEHLDVEFTKTYRDFSLDVRLSMGNALGVLFGYSGAGKSLTLDVIAGLVTPDHGRIRCADELFLDTKARHSLPARRRSIGYVFQKGALFPHMTVRQNIAFAQPRGATDEHGWPGVGQLMEMLGIGNLAHRYPRDISGGQAQRVALARALARRPALLLLDEPFSALDAPVRMQMRGLLRDVRREFRIPVLMVTHDLDEARELGDRIFVYSAGRVIQAGSPQSIISHPVSGEVRSLMCENYAAHDHTEAQGMYQLSTRISSPA